MLQRMQSIWMLLAAICGILTMKYSFFSGNKLGDNQAKLFEFLTATSSILILILTIALVSGILIDIFLYKNRKLQLRIAILAIVVSVVNIFLYYKQTQKFVPGESNYDLTAILSLAIPIFLILAARGIYRDQKLVKSLDRLR
ncbi:MAG: DUF4293 domain-containing protein [Bacteroidetes bacterium]|nr:DUF4293 domain-containing protein [Bacteroidota bacterium]